MGKQNNRQAAELRLPPSPIDFDNFLYQRSLPLHGYSCWCATKKPRSFIAQTPRLEQVIISNTQNSMAHAPLLFSPQILFPTALRCLHLPLFSFSRSWTGGALSSPRIAAAYRAIAMRMPELCLPLNTGSYISRQRRTCLANISICANAWRTASAGFACLRNVYA